MTNDTPAPAHRESRSRQGSISIQGLILLLAALVALTLVLNRIAKAPLPPAAPQPPAATLPADVPPVARASIDGSRIGSTVVISGTVLDLAPPPAGTKRPYALKISDGSGENTIHFWPTEYDQIQGRDALVGASIRARISISSYKDKLQLKLTSGRDLEILSAAATPPPPPPTAAEADRQQPPPPARDFSRGRSTQADLVPIADITPARDGQTLRVQGRVVSVSPPKEGTQQPHAVILKEGDATLRVSWWSTVNDVIAIPPIPGARFEMEGQVEVYQDRPQLKVKSGYKIKQLEAPAAPAPAAPPPLPVTVSSITAADKGQIRTVQGTLGAPRNLGKGTAFPLTDESGSIDLILWNSIVPADVLASLSEGMRVSASGEVGEYEGKLQLKATPASPIQPVNP